MNFEVRSTPVRTRQTKIILDCGKMASLRCVLRYRQSAGEVIPDEGEDEVREPVADRLHVGSLATIWVGGQVPVDVDVPDRSRVEDHPTAVTVPVAVEKVAVLLKGLFPEKVEEEFLWVVSFDMVSEFREGDLGNEGEQLLVRGGISRKFGVTLEDRPAEKHSGEGCVSGLGFFLESFQ